MQTSYSPYELICIQTFCPYPGCGYLMETVGIECIEQLFGIQCCENHRKKAHADCAAFMHANSKLLISSNFLINTGLKFRTFTIRRTNGKLESGWIIHTPQKTFQRARLSKISGDEWAIDLYNPKNNIIKTIPINQIGLESLQAFIDNIPQDEYIL